MSAKSLSATLLALLALLLTTTAAVAHNVAVLRTEPEMGAALERSPTQIAIMFNEELNSQESTVRVYRADGQQVDLRDGGVDLTDPEHASLIVHLPTLDDAAYVVRWHVVLDDGDATDGMFTFTVGNAVPVTAPLTAAFPMARTSNTTLWIGAGTGALLLITAFGFLWRRRGA